MSDMVEKLFSYYQRRLDKKINKQIKEACNTSSNGGKPPKTPPSSSSDSSSNTSFDAHKNHFEKSDMDMPLLKLDIKYNSPMFNGEVNAKKLGD